MVPPQLQMKSYVDPYVLANGDDALAAIRAIGPENHIVLFTPTSPQTHEYQFQPLAQAVADRAGVTFAMDFTPPTNKNYYLPWDERHERALENPDAAGVICVIYDTGERTRGAQMDFAKKVWEHAVADGEMPGVLVEICGSKRPVGDWQTIVYSKERTPESLQDIVRLIFG